MSPLRENQYTFASHEFYRSAEFAWFTWITSILAMIIGFVKFIRLSPFKTNKNILMDLSINVGFVLRVAAVMLHCYHNLKAPYLSIPIVIGLGIIPFLVNIINLSTKAGHKKTWKLILLYPQILLSPIFTPFVYTYQADEKQSTLAECQCRNVNCCNPRHDDNATSCCHSMIEVESKSGFHIWTSISFVNFLYMIIIPAGIPFFGRPNPGKPGRLVWAFSILPPILILFLVGILYFSGWSLCKCCNCIAPVRPTVFDPTNKDT